MVSGGFAGVNVDVDCGCSAPVLVEEVHSFS